MRLVAELKDSMGNLYGSVYDGYEGVAGKLEIRDKYGNRQGHYDPQWNKTLDRVGNVVGEGNLLSSLVSPEGESNSASGDCFVATAVYENADHPDVIRLRLFRDKHLRSHRLGRRFVAWYYRVGPKLAYLVRFHAAKYILQRFIKLVLIVVAKFDAHQKG